MKQNMKNRKKKKTENMTQYVKEKQIPIKLFSHLLKDGCVRVDQKGKQYNQ